MRYHLGRSLRSLLRKPAKLPRISGDAFVFGGAPDPVVPAEILEYSTIVTANASQLTLERFGVVSPDITFMRPCLGDTRATSEMKRKALRGRRTGQLIVTARKGDPDCHQLQSVLQENQYEYEDLLILDRAEALAIWNSVTKTKALFLLQNLYPSMGLRAILTCLAMGAGNVVVSGISLRKDGCSFSDLDYQRLHISHDMDIFRIIQKLRLPVFVTDHELAEDTGLEVWQAS